ncbi:MULTISPECIES: hypothetical protein [Halorussus]|uniref:hypothetical protein n=1 Tax=Halorussus TaxID=1070314 RepID=UPI0020A1EB2F|nr:hypothetical protein [Halorussus vallis]USZ75343.1 hypothetical protein NGM07_18155 [Halorussus vallis]
MRETTTGRAVGRTGRVGFAAAVLLVGVAALAAAGSGTLGVVGPYLLGVSSLIVVLGVLSFWTG